MGRGPWRAPPPVVPLVRYRRRQGLRHVGRGAACLLGVVFLCVIALAGERAHWWQRGAESGGPDAPIAWNEVQALPEAARDPGDAEWLARGQGDYGEDIATGPVSARFGLCHSGGGTNCVVDGDTLWIAGVNIRIADIDAPETHDARCAAEQRLGDRATRRLHALVNSGAVTLGGIGRDSDRYGRKLRIVAVEGVSVGDTLVGEGLARPYAGGRRPWC